MMKTLKLLYEKDVQVAYLVAEMQVRHWHTATVNGKDESLFDPKIPCRKGDMWKLKILLEEGIIENWTKGTTASVHYKVCDAGRYTLLDENRVPVVILEESYVPAIMCPNGDGYGDYVIMEIDENGKIKDWNSDNLIEFQEQSNRQFFDTL